MTVVHHGPHNGRGRCCLLKTNDEAKTGAGAAFPALPTGTEGVLDWLHLHESNFVAITLSIVTLTRFAGLEKGNRKLWRSAKSDRMCVTPSQTQPRRKTDLNLPVLWLTVAQQPNLDNLVEAFLKGN